MPAAVPVVVSRAAQPGERFLNRGAMPRAMAYQTQVWPCIPLDYKKKVPWLQDEICL